MAPKMLETIRSCVSVGGGQPMRDKSEPNEHPVKITQQYRARTGMTYDLKGDGHRLTVHICPREKESDGGDWRVDASMAPTRDTPVVSEWGPSRADALRAAGTAWTSRATAEGLPAFDWDAVAKALQAVRAI